MRGLEEGGVENGPEVNDPPQQNKPEDRRQTKLDDRHQQPALKQLPQAGNKEAAESGKNIASRTLACHAFDLMSGSRIDKFILDADCQGWSELTMKFANDRVARIYAEVCKRRTLARFTIEICIHY